MNINNEPTINVNVSEKTKTKWATCKLIISIISMVLFIIIGFQSCAVSIGDALVDNDSIDGATGFICSLLMLIGGIITISTRNSKENGGSISAIIFYWFGAILTSGTGDTYPDLLIWGSISFIFGLINLGSILAKNPKYKDSKNQKIILISVIIISLLIFFNCIGTEKNNSSTNSTNLNNNTNNTNINNNINGTNNNNDASNTKKVYKLNETFNFDELEITLGNDISYSKVNNQFSDYYGKIAIKIPVVIKNLKDETHSLNMFYYKAFGSSGIEIDSVGYYFDNSVEDAGDLRTGASYTRYFYLVYDGNGTYTIEFDDWSKKITVEFEINK